MKRLFYLSLMLLLLAGCTGESKTTKLKKFVDNVKAEQPQPIEPAPVIVPYQKYTYPNIKRRNPFKPVLPKKVATGKGPDRTRPKQPLETFPFDGLRMVGILRENDKLWAVVSTPGGAVYRVTLGNYVGQHYGKIVKITERTIDVEEMIPRGDGWEKRASSMKMIKQE